MEESSWKVTVVTPGKVYTGKVTVGGSQEKRTISILNASPRAVQYTQSQSTIRPEGFLKLAQASLKAGPVDENYPELHIRKFEIIMVFDEFKSMGSEWEKKRFEQKSFAGWQKVVIMTISRAGQWFRITGKVTQLDQRLMGNESFIPVAQASVEKIIARGKVRGVSNREVPFVAVNKRFIETVTLLDGKPQG